MKSGEYKQGKNTIYNKKTSAYCCLGVLGKLNNCYDPQTMIGYDSYVAAGLVTILGVAKDSYFWGLSVLNDSENYTFPMIADHLLQYPEQYFHEIQAS